MVAGLQSDNEVVDCRAIARKDAMRQFRLCEQSNKVELCGNPRRQFVCLKNKK